MEELLCKAIKERNVITFSYDGHLREVEPFTLGIHKDTGNVSLSAWWIGGHSHSRSFPHWRLYTVSLMSNLEIMAKKASSYQVGYNPRDSRMLRILCTV
ncbi:MAG: hypothetical protein JKY48_08345 [Flavobacteriales bacterium]|nr:hypothetical protein [Flavobacteriales bacterium]